MIHQAHTYFLLLSFYIPLRYIWTFTQIASLTLMKDSERLDLLKEIGGTRVYEERRRESLKIMQETGKSFFISPSFSFMYACM